jgi:hypothetical protein
MKGIMTLLIVMLIEIQEGLHPFRQAQKGSKVFTG